MNTEVKQLWIDALLSGEYPQGRNALRNTYEGRDNFCCLGVLCDLYQKEHPETKWEYVDWQDKWFFDDGGERKEGVPTGVVYDWAGLDEVVPVVSYRGVKDALAVLNDRGVSFAEIAQIIEEQL